MENRASPVEPPIQQLQRTGGRIQLSGAGQVVMACYIVAVILVLPLGGEAKLLAASLLALLVTSMAAAWLNLRGVGARPVPACRCMAATAVELRITLWNRSRWRAARDVLLFHGDPVSLREAPDGYAPHLPPRGEMEIQTLHSFRERGRFDRYEMTLSSSFPLGLVHARSYFSLPADLIVLPRLGTLTEVGALQEAKHGSGTIARVVRKGEDEVFGLKEWREGLNRRLVHWRLSARQGRMILKEMQGEEYPDMHVVLSPFVPSWRGAETPEAPAGRSRRANAGRLGLGDRHPSFEVAVSLTATLVDMLLRQERRVRFTLAGEVPVLRQAARGRHALFELTEPLAEVEAVAVREPPTIAQLFALGENRPGEAAIVVCARGHSGDGEGPERMAAGRVVVLDADSQKINQIFSRVRTRQQGSPDRRAVERADLGVAAGQRAGGVTA